MQSFVLTRILLGGRMVSAILNEFIALLNQEHIGMRVHLIPRHLPPYYRNTFKYRPEDFPNASAAFQRIIFLLTYPKMAEGGVR